MFSPIILLASAALFLYFILDNIGDTARTESV